MTKLPLHPPALLMGGAVLRKRMLWVAERIRVLVVITCSNKKKPLANAPTGTAIATNKPYSRSISSSHCPRLGRASRVAAEDTSI